MHSQRSSFGSNSQYPDHPSDNKNVGKQIKGICRNSFGFLMAVDEFIMWGFKDSEISGGQSDLVFFERNNDQFR
jgi:hypothetical protein